MRAGRRAESAHRSPSSHAGRLSRSTRPSCPWAATGTIEGPIIPAVECRHRVTCHIEGEPGVQRAEVLTDRGHRGTEDSGPVVGLQPLHDLGSRSHQLAAQHGRRRLTLVLADRTPSSSRSRRSRSASIDTNAHAGADARACSASGTRDCAADPRAARSREGARPRPAPRRRQRPLERSCSGPSASWGAASSRVAPACSCEPAAAALTYSTTSGSGPVTVASGRGRSETSDPAVSGSMPARAATAPTRLRDRVGDRNASLRGLPHRDHPRGVRGPVPARPARRANRQWKAVPALPRPKPLARDSRHRGEAAGADGGLVARRSPRLTSFVHPTFVLEKAAVVK